MISRKSLLYTAISFTISSLLMIGNSFATKAATISNGCIELVGKENPVFDTSLLSGDTLKDGVVIKNNSWNTDLIVVLGDEEVTVRVGEELVLDGDWVMESIGTRDLYSDSQDDEITDTNSNDTEEPSDSNSEETSNSNNEENNDSNTNETSDNEDITNNDDTVSNNDNATNNDETINNDDTTNNNDETVNNDDTTNNNDEAVNNDDTTSNNNDTTNNNDEVVNNDDTTNNNDEVVNNDDTTNNDDEVINNDDTTNNDDEVINNDDTTNNDDEVINNDDTTNNDDEVVNNDDTTNNDDEVVNNDDTTNNDEVIDNEDNTDNNISNDINSDDNDEQETNNEAADDNSNDANAITKNSAQDDEVTNNDTSNGSDTSAEEDQAPKAEEIGSVIIDLSGAPTGYVVSSNDEATYTGTTADKHARCVKILDKIVSQSGKTYIVTAITDDALKNASGKELIIGKNIKNIGKRALKGAKYKKITIRTASNGSLSVGKNAFKVKTKKVTIKLQGVKGKNKTKVINKIRRQSNKDAIIK